MHPLDNLKTQLCGELVEDQEEEGRHPLMRLLLPWEHGGHAQDMGEAYDPRAVALAVKDDRRPLPPRPPGVCP